MGEIIKKEKNKYNCCDCIYHTCTNICIKKIKCDGICEITCNKNACFLKSCKNFKFDEFFKKFKGL